MCWLEALLIPAFDSTSIAQWSHWHFLQWAHLITLTKRKNPQVWLQFFQWADTASCPSQPFMLHVMSLPCAPTLHIQTSWMLCHLAPLPDNVELSPASPFLTSCLVLFSVWLSLSPWPMEELQRNLMILDLSFPFHSSYLSTFAMLNSACIPMRYL